MSKIVKVMGWDLEVGEDEEPRVSAFDIAERAGLAEPRKIKRTIDSLVERGEIDAPTMRARQTRIVKTGAKGVAGVEEREVEEPMLDQVQAVLLVMALRTPAAIKLRRLVAQVFVAWAKQQNAELKLLLSEQSEQHVGLLGVIGSAFAKGIRSELRVIAAIDCASRADNSASSKSSALKAFDQELRQRLGYAASGGAAWENLPRTKYADALGALANMRHRVEKAQERAQKLLQATLPGMVAAGVRNGLKRLGEAAQ